MPIESRLRNRFRKPPPTDAEIAAADPGQSTFNTVLNTLLTPLRVAGEAIEAVDAPTRAGVASLLELLGRPAIERTGRQTSFGAAPTGRELLGLGTGTVGQFEGEDIPGFLAEAVVSPLNLLSFLKLTKAGELASKVGKAELNARQLLRSGARTAEAGQRGTLLESLRALRAARNEARAAGLPTRGLMPTLREQVAAGQRGLLSFNPIFSGINVPLGPRGLTAPAAGALGFAGRAVSAPFRPLWRAAFAPGGRIGNAEFDALRDIDQSIVREGSREGTEAGRELTSFIEGLDVKLAERDLAAMRASVDPLAAQAAQMVEQRYAPLIARAATPEKVAKLQKRLANETRDLKNFIATDRDPRAIMLLRGLESRGVDGKIAAEVADIQSEAARLDMQLTADLAAAQAAGATPRDLDRIQAKLTRLRNTTARRVNELEARSDVHAAAMAALPPDFQQTVNKFSLLMGKALEREQAAGVPVSELIDPLLSYVPRIPTREGLEWVKKRGFNTPFAHFAREYSTTGNFTRRRVNAFRGMSITQINDLARTIDPAFKGDFFLENAGEVALRRLTESGERRGAAHFLQGAIESFHLPKAMAAGDAMPVEDFLERANLTRVGQITGTRGGSKKALAGTHLEDTAIPRDIANAALKVHRVVETPAELKKVVDFFDQAHSISRFAVTQLFPSYHARNQLGNWFMMWMGGMRDPRWIAIAAGLQSKLARGTATAAERQLYENAVKHGSFGSSLAAETRALADNGSIIERLPGVLGKTARGIGRFGGGLEDNSKLAMYMWAKSRGMSDHAAGEMVRKFLFDYADLASFEKTWLRRFAFFYTYSRKAVPLLLEQLFTNPRQMRLYGLASGATGPRAEQRDELLPPWLADRGPIALGADDDGAATFLTLGLPIDELQKFNPEGKGFGTVLRKLAAQLAPIPKGLIEGATGTDLRTGRDIQGIREGDISANLPMGVRRELGPLIGIEQYLPSSRFTSTLRRGTEAAGSEEEGTGLDFALSMLGADVRRVDPKRATALAKISRARLAQERAEALGEDEKARRLRSIVGRLSRRMER